MDRFAAFVDAGHLLTAGGNATCATKSRAAFEFDSEEIEAVATALNSKPRKTLGWRTPAEALNDHLLSLQQAGVASTD
jgi:hypothetical protein